MVNLRVQKRREKVKKKKKKDLWQLIRNNELLRVIPQFQMTLTFTKSSLFYRKNVVKI